MKILLIDDAQISRNLLKEYIENTKHEVIGEAENGIEGLQKYKELKPDLIILDMRMPKMTGIEFLKEINDMDENVKVLVCSAVEDRTVIIEAMELFITYTCPSISNDIQKRKVFIFLLTKNIELIILWVSLFLVYTRSRSCLPH